MIPKKKTKKEEAQPLAAVDASVSQVSENTSFFNPIIEENAPNVKATKSKTAKMPKNLGGLTMESKVPDLSIKIYEEQLTVTIEEFAEIVRNVDPKDYWIIAIVHDRDQVADEIFVEAYKKRHIHILAVKQGKDSSKRAERRKVSTFLSLLKIVFRPDEDASIWANHGVERIRDLDASVAYLTHETDQAQKDGKELYDREEIISNLTPEEIDQLRDGYKRLTHSKHKVTVDEQILLAETAYKAGNSGELTWREFVATLPFLLQKGSIYNLYRERYQLGVDDRMAEKSEVIRLCVFIQGEANQGKTYAAKHAFDGMGLKVLEIGDGGKTGKFDKVKEEDDVMVIDDAIVPDLLGMADNKVCAVYRRNGFNPYWCGRYFIVTSNLSFEDWANRCHIDKHTLEAAKSRFYICQVVDDGNKKFLDCSQVSKRGTPEQQRCRLDMFLEFRRRFDALVGAYRPSDEEVDYTAVLGPSAAPRSTTSAESATGWLGSKPNEDGQLSLPEDPSECLPF